MIARKKTHTKENKCNDIGMYSFLYTLLVKTGYNKQNCVVTRLITLMFEKRRDIRMTTAEKIVCWDIPILSGVGIDTSLGTALSILHT